MAISCKNAMFQQFQAANDDFLPLVQVMRRPQISLMLRKADECILAFLGGTGI